MKDAIKTRGVSDPFRLNRFPQNTKEANRLIQSAFPRVGKSKITQNMLKNPGGWKNALRGTGLSFAIRTGGNIGAQKIAKTLGAGERGQKIAGQGAQATLSSIAAVTSAVVRKKGLPWLLSQITRKAGVGFGLKIAAKLGVGLVGGIGTGGLATAAMASWAAADIYKLYKIITEIGSNVQTAPKAKSPAVSSPTITGTVIR